MLRAVLLAFLFAPLLAGCLGTDGPTAATDAGSEGTAGPASNDDGSGDGRGDGPDDAQDSEGDDRPDDPGEARDDPGPTTWFLHAMRDCDAEPCNCGSVAFFMDRIDTEGECDGRGGRPNLPHPFPDGCEHECWPATQSMPLYPAGSSVEGLLYVTTDAADTMTIDVALRRGSEVLGAVHLDNVEVIGAGGATYAEVPFSFELDAPVPDAKVRLQAYFDATTSYFIGYDGDHVSRFTIG